MVVTRTRWLDCTTAVSYTHLDVYKRQVCSLRLILGKGSNNSIASATVISLSLIHISLPAWTAPVKAPPPAGGSAGPAPARPAGRSGRPAPAGLSVSTGGGTLMLPYLSFSGFATIAATAPYPRAGREELFRQVGSLPGCSRF